MNEPANKTEANLYLLVLPRFNSIGRVSACQGKDLSLIPGPGYFSFCWHLIIQPAKDFPEVNLFHRTDDCNFQLISFTDCTDSNTEVFWS